MSEDVTATFVRLRQLKAACGFKPSKHDLAIVLISACIEEGFNTGPRITGALAALGLNRRHAGITLATYSGRGDGCLWFKADDGRYRLADIK